MRAIAKLIASCLIASSLLVAPVQAQEPEPHVSTPTTLYFHIFDTFNRFVVNTQPMDAEFFEVGGTNNPTLAEAGWDQNTIYGYSTAGPVEYDFIENGKPRLHPERGIAADVQLDASKDATAYLYLDIRDVMGVDSLPHVIEDMTFRVTLQEGDDPGRDADYDAGKDIMVGETTVRMGDATVNPANLPNSAAVYALCLVDCSPKPEKPLPEDAQTSAGNAVLEGAGYLVPDETGIVEVPIAMEFLEEVIPKKEAYNVRIDWYQTAGGFFGEDEFATNHFRLYADPDHLPRLDFHIFNPIFVDFLHPQVAGGALLIHAGVNSPWGTYDVDEDSIRINIDGPGEPQEVARVVAPNKHVHGLHDQPVQITYIWKFRDEGAPVGEYTITIEAQNQGVAAQGEMVDGSKVTASDQARFVIEEKQAVGFDSQGNAVEPTLDDEEVDTPGVGFLGAIALLGAALIAARRRWNE